MYEIVDMQTKLVVGRAQTRKRAQSIADKKDLQYGAIRYYVRLATESK